MLYETILKTWLISFWLLNEFISGGSLWSHVPVNAFTGLNHDRLTPETLRVIVSHPLIGNSRPFGLAQYKKYGCHVQHLLVGGEIGPFITDALAYCPNITNLAMYLTQNTVDIWTLTELPLKRLVISTQVFLTNLRIYHDRLARELDVDDHRDQGSVPPIFPHITHLDTLSKPFVSALIADQSNLLAYHFPSLTHVAVFDIMTGRSAMLVILEKCKSLKVLVSWRPGDLAVDMDRRSPVDDPRVVLLRASKLRDWEDAARGWGKDIWELADDVLAQRLARNGQ